MDKEKCKQWHPAFYGALRLELAGNKQDLEYTEELILNTLPLQADTLIIKKKRECEIENEIGKIFRHHNLVEYKSPDDSFNHDTFLKGIAYAYLYKSKEAHVDDILLEDITLSFIRERKPIKLIKKLIEDYFFVEEKYPGIYYIHKDGFIPIQIVVSRELDEKNHIWLNSLTSKMKRNKAEELISVTRQLKDMDDKNYADSVWEIITSANKELIRKIKEDTNMCKALAEIMKPEIDIMMKEALEDGFNNGFNNGFNDGFNDGLDKKGIQVFKNMIQRGFSREEAQCLAEISDELVEKALKEC